MITPMAIQDDIEIRTEPRAVHEPAWAELGSTFDRPMTATEAVEAAGLNFTVEKSELYTKVGGIELPANKMALVRGPAAFDPDPMILGFAGKNYTVIQNRELARMLDPITEQFPVEAAGYTGRGETIFFVLDAGLIAIEGDMIKSYYLILDTKDGGSSIKVFYMPVRVDSQAVLITGLDAASISSSFTHGENARHEFEFHLMLVKLEGAKEHVHDVFSHLMHIPMSQSHIARVLEEVYPLPAVPAKVKLLDELQSTPGAAEANRTQVAKLISVRARYEYYSSRMEHIREKCLEEYNTFNADYPRHANTGWAIFNAVCQMGDWREGNSTQSVAEQTLWGHRAAEKARALKMILKIDSEFKPRIAR